MFEFAATVLVHDDLLAVAFLPCMIPARAARADPVQIVMTCLTFGAVLRIYAMVAFSLVGLRHPGPPGMISTSRSGAVSKVCVGVREGYTEEFSGFIAADAGRVVTGSKVSAM